MIKRQTEGTINLTGFIPGLFLLRVNKTSQAPMIVTSWDKVIKHRTAARSPSRHTILMIEYCRFVTIVLMQKLFNPHNHGLERWV
jgi:hypothetical protein